MTTVPPLRCPRCHKTMSHDATQDEGGRTRGTYRCDHCTYVETGRGAARPWTASERQRRIRLAREQLYGPREPVIIPLAYDTPSDEMDEAYALAESETPGHLEPAELVGGAA